MNLPIYKLNIDFNENETGVNCISFVEFPAVEKDFLKFNNEEKQSLKFYDDSKHIITGVAMLADTPIYRNNLKFGEHYVVFDAETIQKIVEKFFKNGNGNFVNLQHNGQMVNNVIMFESYLVDKERGIYPVEFGEIPNGSWIVSYKINNPEIWEKLTTTKELNGFSVEGIFDYCEQFKKEKTKTKEELFIEEITKIFEELR